MEYKIQDPERGWIINPEVKWNFKKIHEKLSYTYRRQMEIKSKFPKPAYSHTYYKETEGDPDLARAWREERAEFEYLSDNMTFLCCLLNHAKGKLHMETYRGSSFDKESQEAFISKGTLWREYILEEEEVSQPKLNVVGRFVKALGL